MTHVPVETHCEGGYSPVDVLEAIRRRRSVRQFRPDPVPEEMLRTLLDAARLAPSSYNLQPWEFVVVTDPEVRRRLRVAANNQAQVEEAPAVIVCLGSLRQQDALAARLEASLPPDAPPERRERVLKVVRRHKHDPVFRKIHVLTSTYIGVAFLVLAAQSLGLGTCWMGGFDPDKVRALLGIPEDFLVASLVAVGWPAEGLEFRPRQRRPLEEIVHWNHFGRRPDWEPVTSG